MKPIPRTSISKNLPFPNGEKKFGMHEQVLQSTSYRQSHHIQSQVNSQINSFFQTFKDFVQNQNKQKLSKNFNSPLYSYEIQPRSKQIIYPLPQLNNSKLQHQTLKYWLTQMTGTVISSAFYYYSKKQMNYDQAKIFCSEKLLKNLANLHQRYPLSSKQLMIIDNHFCKGILPHQLLNYPMTESKQINKKLQELVRQVNSIQQLSNNYFYQSDIIFQLRQSGNYNDLIMRVINDLIGRISNTTPQNQKANYIQFKQTMQGIFQKVYDMDWMNNVEYQTKKVGLQNAQINQNTMQNYDNDKKQKKIQQQATDDESKQKQQRIAKQKYRNSVKQYTEYAINRKIPENITLFLPKQIQNKNLKIKHPSVLRMLTKWCQQLLQKYTQRNYFLNKISSVKLLKGGNVSNLQNFMKQFLNQQIQVQAQKVQQFMKDIYQNNYQMQSYLFDAQLKQKGNYHINFIQKVCGKFTVKIVNNLHTYVLIYLNRLIHGLMTVAYKFHKTFTLSVSAWPYPPNLLTFCVGDLMRCKCTSKQKQIIKIYKQIWRLSRQNPQKLKIVRIKNRLRLGTNDIFINARFNNLILCQIQLCVSAKATGFLQYSNKFNHFLYQLQRSLFGPITQLCNVWYSLDPRTKSYIKMVQKQQPKLSIKAKNIRQQQLKPFGHPFICSQCGLTYFHDNYIKNHLKSRVKDYWRCAICQIAQQSTQNLIKSLIVDKNLAKSCLKRFNNASQKFPEFGIAIFIEQKSPKIQTFRIYELEGCKYLLTIKNNKIYQVAKIITSQQLKIFLQKYIVFQIENTDNKHIHITDEMARKQYILPRYVNECYKMGKQTISMVKQNLFDKDIQKILAGDLKDRQIIKTLFLAKNNITKVQFIVESFPNLHWLQLNYNYTLKDYSYINKLSQLKQLILDTCPLTTLPLPVCMLEKLQQITISQSQIQTIPQQVSNWKFIKHIQIDYNKLSQLPISFCSLKTLKNLNLNGNSLKQLPKGFENLASLQKLYLGKNQFKNIPQGIFKLNQLKQFYFHMNSITKIIADFSKLTKLQTLNLSDNNIQAIQLQFKLLPSLKILQLDNIKFNYIPNLSGCFNLQKFIFNFNKCQHIGNNLFNNLNKLQILQIKQNSLATIQSSAFCHLTKLKYLDISKNQLVSIGNWIANLTDLLIFKCDDNKISNASDAIGYCRKLQRISLCNNNIQVLPESFDQCLNLISIRVSDNKIKVLPAFCQRLPSLDEIILQNNKIKQIIVDQQHLVQIIKGIKVEYCSQRQN